MKDKTNSNLKDVTFIIPLRLDSPERLENIQILVSFLQNHFVTNIMVLEADNEEKYIPAPGVHKLFICDKNPVFHHSRYRNEMVKEADTDIIAVWDSDALCNAGQITTSVNILRNKQADMIYPFDGRYYVTHKLFKLVYKEAGENIKVFEKNIGKFHLMHGYSQCGAAFLAQKKTFCEAGMENENFFGWAPEDEERYKRWEILGYRILRVNGPMFHLDHPRGKTSRFANKENQIRSRQEFLKVCRMNPAELRDYVNSWTFLEKYH